MEQFTDKLSYYKEEFDFFIRSNWRSITNFFSLHNIKIYFTRLGYAIIGKKYTPMCCYTYSLDGSIAEDFVAGLEYLIPKKIRGQIIEEDRQKDYRELLELWREYIWEFNIPVQDILTKDSIEEYNKQYDKKYNRMFELTKKHFRSLRY